MVDCAGLYYYNDGCNGGWTDEAIQYAQDAGMVEDSYYPYQAEDEFCFYDPYMVVLKPSGHVYVNPNNAKALKTAIADGPVSVGVDADSSVFQFYTDGILNSPNCGTDIDHAIVAVGYGVDPTKGEYYIVRNSWGPSWGDRGYLKIAIVDGVGICAIQKAPVYPTYK